jgi:hypothetical protein
MIESEEKSLSPSVSSEPSSKIKAAASSSLNRDEGQFITIFMDDPEDDIEFVTLHNILYYLYTGFVNLRVGSEEYPRHKKTHPLGYPGRPDPFELYKSSKKFLLSSLTDYCLRYLKKSLNNSNVVERLFRPDSELRSHEELKDLYRDYLLTNYDKIKETKGWRSVVCGRDDNDPEAREFHNELLFEITERLTYAHLATTSAS